MKECATHYACDCMQEELESLRAHTRKFEAVMQAAMEWCGYSAEMEKHPHSAKEYMKREDALRASVKEALRQIRGEEEEKE